jgi:hypothetical protein
MIITESFVWINYPKTASTFVRNALTELYEIKPLDFMKAWRFRSRFMKEVMCPELRPETGERHGTPTPHGTVSQIPLIHKRLPVVSAFRDPADRYISLYNFGDWKSPDVMPESIDKIKETFPSYPNLNLPEFIRYITFYYGQTRLKVGDQEWSIGAHSADFLRFFTKYDSADPTAIKYDSWKSLENEISAVKFLYCDNINQELYEWLSIQKFHRRDIEFIINKSRVNVSPRSNEGKELDGEILTEVKKSEWFLISCMQSNFRNVSEALKNAAHTAVINRSA